LKYAFPGLVALVIVLSAGVYYLVVPKAEPQSEDTSMANAAASRSSEDVTTRSTVTKPVAPEIASTQERPGLESGDLTSELQHLQVMEIELAKAKSAVATGKRRLAQLEKQGPAGATSLAAQTTRDKLKADRNIVDRLKSAIKDAEQTIARLQAETAQQKR